MCVQKLNYVSPKMKGYFENVYGAFMTNNKLKPQVPTGSAFLEGRFPPKQGLCCTICIYYLILVKLDIHIYATLPNICTESQKNPISHTVYLLLFVDK